LRILAAFALWLWLLCPFLRAASKVDVSGNLNWSSYGNDLANTRFQDVDQINPSNVKDLEVAWVFHTGVLDPLAELEVSPVVIDGTIFVTDGHSNLFALDAATGEQIWAYKPLDMGKMPPLSQISVCCGRNNKGVAFGNGKVFHGRLDNVVVALDAETGKILWETKVADFKQRLALNSAPQFVDGLVIVSLSGGEYVVRGQVIALDAEKGDEVWRFFATLPESYAKDSYLRGGAAVWNPPAIDEDLGLIYIATSNAAPDVLGEDRAGDNLFSASIVALDLSTGKHVWHFQEVHHDIWDYDSAQPVVLFPLKKDGKELKALGHCSKNGNYYILDRETGEPIFPVTEVPVETEPAWQHPSPTQPVSAVEPLTPLTFVPGTIDFTKLPPDVSLAPQYTPPQERELLIVPGDDGGCEWNPAAYSPRTQYVYYGTRYEPTTFHTFPGNTSPNPEGFFLGSTFKNRVPGVKAFGLYGATDTQTGKVVWKIQVDQPAKSGVLVAGDLVFFGEGNGRFHAAHAATGEVLFTFNGPAEVANAGGAQANPVAYVVNGREFIVNAFGGNVPDRNNFPPNPVGDAIIAFALPEK
jgi:alcohol dehydrogenase (cytochrome c)